MSIQTIKKEISKLSKKEQEELMEFMFDLLGNDNFYLSTDLKEEIDNRAAALEKGTSKGRSARAVIAKMKDIEDLVIS